MQQAWQLILLLLLQGYQHCITILDMRLIHILEILMGITTKVKINIMPTSNQQLILLINKWELVKIQTTAGYQSTTAGYQSGGYASQTSVWNGGNNGSYPPYDYSNYTAPDPNANHNASSVSGAPLQYQQQYNQWPTHYSQASSNVLCAPGTEKRVVSNSSNDSPVPGSSGGCSYGNNQPPPPGTTSWRQDFASTGLPSSQGMNDAMRYNQNGSYNAVATGDQNHQINQMPSYFQTSSNLLHHSDVLHSENQQKTVFSQGPNFQFPVTNQLSQNFQSPSQTAYTPDAHQGTKIQIPTNPRIALNLAVNASKTDKESTTVDSTLKPVYISVSAPNKKEYSQDSAENISKGAIPASLRRYVDRTFARCKDDAQRASNQIIMKEMITKSSADGTLLTRNWDMEPLFPLANNSADTADKKSPVRRTKSRWEPLPEEKFVEKLHSANHVSIKSVWNRPKDNTKVAALLMCNGINFGNKENSWSSLKFVPSQQQPSTPNTQRPLKKQRYSDTNTVDGGDISSESDKEQNLTKYYSSAIALADTPEERKRREHRSKRFEEGQEHQSEFNYSRQKGVGVRRLYTQRTKALLLAKNCQDVSNNVVEDISWDSFTVKGTCHEIEKRYLRLTSSPDPASVRPEEVLEKALVMVQSSQKNYLYKCDQLKSIRQDLTVQRIRNQLTAKVYETHARFALEAGDLAEFNQCQSQLKSLYAEGIKGCHLEFSAYSLLSLTLHSNNKRELLSSMARLPAEAKKDEAVGHAFAVRTAVMTGNYIMFFRLYKKAPNLSICFMDLYVERMRFEAVSCMCKSYRPAVPVAYVARVLGFSKVSLEDNEGDSDGVEECEEWLRAHGASLIADNGDMQLDTKASSSNLFMPEPDDAVVHGDANLAVDDFLTRAT